MTPLQKFYRNFTQTCLVIAIVAAVVWTSRAVDALRIPHAKAAERLALVAELAHNRLITLPKPKKPASAPKGMPVKVVAPGKLTTALRSQNGYWQAPGEPAYKNDRLHAYQDLLRKRGITDPSALRLLSAQLLQENGALSEDRDGDHGCSIGIPQRNTCNLTDPLTGKRFTAKTFRLRYPAWTDWRYQLSWMADKTAWAFQHYKQDIRLTIIAHNSPAAAARGTDTRAGYFQKISARSKQLVAGL